MSFNPDARIHRTHPLSSPAGFKETPSGASRVHPTQSSSLEAGAQHNTAGFRDVSSMTPFQRHEHLMRMRKPSSRSQNTTLAENSSISDRDILNIVTDESLLRSAYRFMPSAADDDGSYEAALAQRYYSKLFREYVIADLSRYTTGAVGLRWRTEQEVMRGKGQFICGARGCDFADNTQMSSYEVLFEYKEPAAPVAAPAHASSPPPMKRKSALVKVRLCRPCAAKLHHQQLQKRRAQALAQTQLQEQGPGEPQEERQERKARVRQDPAVGEADVKQGRHRSQSREGSGSGGSGSADRGKDSDSEGDSARPRSDTESRRRSHDSRSERPRDREHRHRDRDSHRHRRTHRDRDRDRDHRRSWSPTRKDESSDRRRQRDSNKQ